MKNVVRFAAPLLAGIAGFWIGRIESVGGGTNAASVKRVAAVQAREPSAMTSGDDPMLIAVITALRNGCALREMARAGEILARLNAVQMRALMDRVDAWPTRDRNRWLPRLIDDWTRADPESATEWMKPRLAGFAMNPWFGAYWRDCELEIVEAWAERAPDRAVKYARTVSRTSLAGKILSRALNRLPDLSIPERLSILLEFPDSDGRDRALNSFFSRWAQTDPEATFSAATSLPPGKARDSAMAESLARWVSRDPAAILAKVSSLGISEPSVLGMVAKEAAKSNPAATGRWLADRNPDALPIVGVIVAKFWAQTDPAAAFAWAEEHGISLLALPDSRALKPPDGVSGMHRYELDSETPFQEALSAKPAETLAWMRSLPVGPERDRLVEVAVRGLDGESMERLFLELSPDGAIRCAGMVGARMAALDVDRAREWASGLADPDARAAAWKGIGGGREEPLPIPPGPDRDAMLAGMALARSTDKPEVAFARMLEIADPARRRETFDDILWQVFRDPVEIAPGVTMARTPQSKVQAVREWVKNSSVPHGWKRDWNRQLDDQQ